MISQPNQSLIDPSLFPPSVHTCNTGCGSFASFVFHTVILQIWFLAPVPGWSSGVDKTNVRKSKFLLKQEPERTTNIITCASCKQTTSTHWWQRERDKDRVETDRQKQIMAQTETETEQPIHIHSPKKTKHRHLTSISYFPLCHPAFHF